MPSTGASEQTWTTRKLLAWMSDAFTKKGLDSPRLLAEMLMAHVIGCERLKLYTDPDRPANDLERETLRTLVTRALKHEPVQYLVGEAWFFGMPFHVDKRVLIPRPATETIVEHVAETMERLAESVGQRLDTIEEKILSDDSADLRRELGRLRRTCVRLHRQLSGLLLMFRRLDQQGPEILKPALRLRAGKLAQRLDAARARRPDLLVVNRFGRLEAEGGGMRAEIAAAIADGLALLIAVPTRFLDAWNEFAGGLDTQAPPTEAALSAWWDGIAPLQSYAST